jgi:hypothetical protein
LSKSKRSNACANFLRGSLISTLCIMFPDSLGTQ